MQRQCESIVQSANWDLHTIIVRRMLVNERLSWLDRGLRTIEICTAKEPVLWIHFRESMTHYSVHYG